MVTITAKFENLDQVQAALREFGAQAEAEIGKAVQAHALDVRSDIQRRIQRGPKTGTTYFRIPGDKYMTIRAGSADGPPVAFVPGGGKGNLSGQHQASAPGEAPATDTGFLVSSIVYRQKNALTAEIESRLPYATWLEFGTQDGRIKPRPAWTQSVEAKTPDFIRRVTDAIARASK